MRLVATLPAVLAAALALVATPVLALAPLAPLAGAGGAEDTTGTADVPLVGGMPAGGVKTADDPVGGTVGDTVGGTVGDTVGGTVGDTVGGTVGGTVEGATRTVGGTVQTVEGVTGGLTETIGGTVGGAVGLETEAPAVPDPDQSKAEAQEMSPAAAAAPIATVGSAAVAWHLRFVPWRRMLSVATKALGAVPFLGLFSRIEDDALKDHPVRARILQVLEERPGSSIAEIQDAAEVAWGTVVYHLGRLSQARHVVSERDGRNHRYWIESDPEARNRSAAFVLKRPTPAAIAAAIQEDPGIHQGAICKRLEILPATASKYLKRLAEQGLVSVRAEAQRRLYYPTPSLEALATNGDVAQDPVTGEGTHIPSALEAQRPDVVMVGA